MTDDFMNYVKNEYDKWVTKRRNYIRYNNIEYEKEIANLKRIRELLTDDRVQEFANLINYREKEINRKYIVMDDPMYEFLYQTAVLCEWPFESLKEDKYPIYCYIKSQGPIYSEARKKRISDYQDIYWNLQQPGHAIGPTDRYKNGKNRENFKKNNNIIYAPEGKSFIDLKEFFKVQTEYVNEACNSSQEEATKLILSKYGKK